jgi:Ulp1 family protease
MSLAQTKQPAERNMSDCIIFVIIYLFEHLESVAEPPFQLAEYLV